MRLRGNFTGIAAVFLCALTVNAGAQSNLIVTVRHAPSLNGTGRIEGSAQQLLGESVTLNSGFVLTGDLIVPGTPNIITNGSPSFAGVIVGTGATSPTGYYVTLNGGVSLQYLRTRSNAVSLPTVTPPPSPTGTRSVTINAPGQSIGDPATLRNLTLNGNVGQYAVPPGTYGTFMANGGSGFTLGVAGATNPSTYNLQSLTLNGSTRLDIVGPIILKVANGFTGNGLMGTTNQSSWLQLQLSSGGFTLNSGCTMHGSVVAPAGTVIINGSSYLLGSVKSDRLTVNSGGIIKGGSATVNQPPVASAQSVMTAEDTAKTITLTGSDPENAPLTYTVLTQPTRGVLTGTAPNLTYTPGLNENGADSFTFKVNDGAQDSATATVTITITAVNDAPVAQSQSISTAEDMAAPVTLIGSDVEGSTLTYTVVTQPLHGVLLNSAPDLLYVPDPNYNGPDSFTFRVNDGSLDSALATVSITVSPLNDRPVADAQSLATDEDTALPVPLTGTDIENDPLTFTVLTQPAHGTLSGTAPNLSYLPATNYNGSDSFAFEVSDGSTNSLPATISLTIQPVNDQPVAYATNYTTVEDTATNVVITASDIEDTNLTYTVVTQPAHGTVTGAGAELIYSPAANYHGPDSFTFKASDGTLDSDTVTVTLTISAVNDTPVADAKTISTDEDVAEPITLTGSDVDGDTITFTVLTQPANGALTGTPPNLVYTPDANYHGPDSFTYEANDGSTNSTTALVSITVNSVNDAPEAEEQLLATDEDTPLPVVLLGTDTDGDTLTFTVISPPLFGVLSGVSPNLTYTPDANFNGTDSFIYIANDGQSDSPLAIATIDVLPVNDAPVATPQFVNTLEDTPASVVLGGVDVDGDVLSFTILTPPAHGILSGAAPNLVYTPAPNYHGPDSFTFSVNDGSETSLPALVSIAVEAVNDPPVANTQQVETDQDVAINFSLTGSDVDGDAITFAIVTQPAHGTLSGTARNLTYTPTNGFFGSDGFTFVANDGQAMSAPATVTIHVAQGESGDFTVEAGADQVITFTSTTLTGAVVIPTPVNGVSTNVVWSKTSGPGTVQFVNSSALATEVTFAEPGNYVLKLRVTYSGGQRSDTLTVAVLPPPPDRLTAARSSRGSEFWLTFLDNGHPFGEPGHSGLSFAVTSETNTTGVVSFYGQGEWHTNYFTVNAGVTTVVPIADYWSDPTLAYSDAIQDNGIHIVTENEVTVYALNYLDFTTDGYLAMPVSLLGTEYIVLGYKNSPAVDNPGQPVGGTQFAVVGTEDETLVTITPTLTTDSRVAGVPFQITLQRGQTYRLMNVDSLTGDLSGTIIFADKPVAVFGGHQCANVPAGVFACDHLVEQLPPVNQWGRQFVTMPLARRSGGDTFRILAMADNTLVAVNGEVVARLNRGQFYERTNNAPTQFSASEPVLVAQYANGSSFDGSTGDPFMMLVPPAEQFGGAYTLATPRLFDYWAYQYVDLFTNYLNLIVRTNGTGAIQLDGSPVSTDLFQLIGSSGYAGAQVAVPPGTHRLTGTVPFGVSLYGWASFESYAYLGGIYSESIEADTQLVLRQVSDHALVGTEKVVTASVTNGRQRPLAGVEVTFTVTGANGVTRRVRTNPFGEAVFAYTGLTAGEDVIQAVVVSLQQSVANVWLQSSDNLPPVVYPGVNQLVSLNQAAHLAATVNDDGKPVGATLVYQWRTASGYVPARFTQLNEPVTDVTFDLPGVYQLELTVSDSMFSVRSNITITVNDVPRVRSLWSYPFDQPYSVGQTVTLLAQVSDSDGSVTNVEFFDGESKIGETGPPGGSGIVSIDWAFPQPGNHPITILVTDDLGGATRSVPLAIRVVSPPLVEWINPTNAFEAIAGVPLPLNISATDLDGTVTNVVFVVDYYTPDYARAEFIATGTGPNYTGNWTPPRAGDYYFSAYAWDNDGAAGAAGIYVHVVEQPPALEIVSPSNGSLLDVSNAVPVFVSLDDPSLLVTNLEFLVDGVKIGDSAISFLSWIPTNLGAHTIQAVAVDRHGGRTPSALVNVTVSDLLPPVVAVVSPTNDARLSAGTLVSLEAVASDPDGVVTNLVLQLDGLEIIQTNIPTLQLTWTNTSGGWHTLLALATDDHGQTAVAETIRFFVERTEDAGLPAPEGFVAEAISDRENKLTWLPAPTNVVVAGVIIEQQSPVDGSWSELTLASTEITSHNNSDLEPETRYGYRAAFVGENGQRSAYSAVALQTTRTTVPGFGIIDITDSLAAAQAGQSQGGAGGFAAFAAASAPTSAALAPLDLGSLEPLWMADDGTCLLFAGPGHYVVWKFGTPPISLVNSNFIAHRLTRHGVVVGRLQLPDGADSFGHQLPRSRGVLWIPGQPGPVEITPDDYAYRFPKDADIAPNVGLTYQLTGTPSGLPELIGLVQDFPTLHDVWDLNAAGQAAGTATVYLRPFDFNNDGTNDVDEISFSPSERHQYTTNGDLNWLIITERGVTAGYSGDAFHQVHYNAMLASAARFDTNGWRWLGPLATNDANGSASALSIALLANDAGMIAGYAAARTGNPQVDALFPSHAFRYTPASAEYALGVSVLTDLGVLSGGLDSFPRAMNQYGEIVGHADFDTLQPGGGLRDPRMLHAVYWTANATSPNDLGTLGPVPGLGFPNGHSDAFAINDLTQIVGTSYRPSDGASTAVFWQLNRNQGPGTNSAPFWEITDLNSRLSVVGWHLLKAVGINNDGLILAKANKPILDNDGNVIGWEPRAVLLAPFRLVPDVLAVNSDFDEKKFDANGWLKADNDDADPRDADGRITTEILADYFQPVLGKPFTERLDENTSIIISKNTNRFDVEIQDREEGEIRVIALRESDNAWVEVPQDANIVPQFLRAEGTYASYRKWYVEGLHPGRITLEFRYSDGVAEHVIEQRCLVATHKSRAQWRREVQGQIFLQTRGIVDLRGFNPFTKEFSENQKYLIAVYGYYSELFLKHPNEFIWAGMAKMAGAPVFAGLSDADVGRRFVGSTVDEILNLKRFQSALMEINLRIFEDLAWQHRAYEASGIYALQYVDSTDSTPIDPLTLRQVAIQNWFDLDSGRRSAVPAQILSANLGLLQREQEKIVQPIYDYIQQLGPLGIGEYGQAMSILAENPIPGGPAFAQVGSGGNLAVFSDRWRWINNPTNGMFQIWTGTLPPYYTTGARFFWVTMPLSQRANSYRLVPPNLR